MRSVLISIQPKWCELIANGKKTIELRKTKPKIQIPFKCYIYCTLSGSNDFFHTTLKSDIAKWNTGNWGNRKGKVIGEFICDKIDYISPSSFVVKEEAEHKLKGSCISVQQAKDYGKWYSGMSIFDCKPLYGWHVSELVIYDKPKDLSEFMALGALNLEELQEDVCNYCRPTQRGEIKMSHGPNGVYMCEGRFCVDAYETYLDEEFSLKRPPQSWCYIEEHD